MTGLDEQRWSQLAALADPVRRRLYLYVEQAQPVTRDEAAAALSLSRSLVTHHMARLEQEGLLTAMTEAPTGRPGRPAVRYHVGARPGLPQRRYEVLADLLARAVPRSSRTLLVEARRRGAAAVPSAGTAGQRAAGALSELGFAPAASRGVLRSTSCPFLDVATEQPEVACAVARALAEGVADEVPGWQVRARTGGPCCVELVAS